EATVVAEGCGDESDSGPGHAVGEGYHGTGGEPGEQHRRTLHEVTQRTTVWGTETRRAAGVGLADPPGGVDLVAEYHQDTLPAHARLGGGADGAEEVGRPIGPRQPRVS